NKKKKKNTRKKKNKRRRRCEFPDPRFRRRLSFRRESRRFSVAKERAGESWRSPDRGERKVNGGPKPRGRAMNGTARCGRYAQKFNRKGAGEVKKRPRCIASTKTCARSVGSWKESTIEIRRAALF